MTPWNDYSSFARHARYPVTLSFCKAIHKKDVDEEEEEEDCVWLSKPSFR